MVAVSFKKSGFGVEEGGARTFNGLEVGLEHSMGCGMDGAQTFNGGGEEVYGLFSMIDVTFPIRIHAPNYLNYYFLLQNSISTSF